MDDALLQQIVVCVSIAGEEMRRLRALRRAAGLTQAQVAARSGVTQETISRIERGCHPPQETTLRQVAQVLAVPPADESTVCVDVRGLPRSLASVHGPLRGGWPVTGPVSPWLLCRLPVARHASPQYNSSPSGQSWWRALMQRWLNWWIGWP